MLVQELRTKKFHLKCVKWHSYLMWLHTENIVKCLCMGLVFNSESLSTYTNWSLCLQLWSWIFQTKQVPSGFSTLHACVTESPSLVQFITFVWFGWRAPSNVPIGSVLPSTLIWPRMPLNESPLTHAEVKKTWWYFLNTTLFSRLLFHDFGILTFF